MPNSNRNGRSVYVIAGASIVISVLSTTWAQLGLAPRVNESTTRLTIVENDLVEHETEIGLQGTAIDAHDVRIEANDKELNRQEKRIEVLISSIDDLLEQIRQILTESR